MAMALVLEVCQARRRETNKLNGTPRLFEDLITPKECPINHSLRHSKVTVSAKRLYHQARLRVCL